MAWYLVKHRDDFTFTLTYGFKYPCCSTHSYLTRFGIQIHVLRSFIPDTTRFKWIHVQFMSVDIFH